MHCNTTVGWAGSIALGLFCVTLGTGAAPPGSADPKAADTAVPAPPTTEEARARARLLHETVRATLHTVHQRYYREGQGLPLPARALKEVFGEVARRSNVKLQWLAVNTEPMNVDHNPKNDFEKQAAQALASGKAEFELAENGVYRRVGPIVLETDCLLCHLPNRMNAKERTAGLLITMPVKNP